VYDLQLWKESDFPERLQSTRYGDPHMTYALATIHTLQMMTSDTETDR